MGEWGSEEVILRGALPKQYQGFELSLGLLELSRFVTEILLADTKLLAGFFLSEAAGKAELLSCELPVRQRRQFLLRCLHETVPPPPHPTCKRGTLSFLPGETHMAGPSDRKRIC